jgi:hypothetical protein
LFVLVCENVLKLHQTRSIGTILSGALLDFNRRRLGGGPLGERRHCESLLGKYRRRTPLCSWDTLVGARQTPNARAICLCV